MNGSIRLAGAMVLASAAVVGSAFAQVQPPVRDIGGVFGGARTTPGDSKHQLTFDGSLLGGYDDDVSGSNGQNPDPSNPAYTQPSNLAEGSGALVYRYGRRQRFVKLTGYGSARTYSALDYDWQGDGGGSAEFYSAVNRSVTFRAKQDTAYRNYLMVGDYSHLTPVFQPDLIPSSPSFALGARQAWTNDTTAELSTQWSRSQSTTFGGSFYDVSYADSPEGEVRALEGHVRHGISMSRSTSFLTGYTYRNGDYGRSDGSVRGVDEQTLDGSVRHQRRLSRTRSLTLEGGVGASLIDTISDQTHERIQPWNTVGHAYVSTDLSRSWSVRGSYLRGWEFQEGFSDPLFFDTIGVSVGGFLNSRTDVTFGAAASRGTVGYSGLEDYNSQTASVQGRYALNRNMALFASYVYYFYDFASANSVPDGFPQHTDRQVIRVGINFWVPIVGVWNRAGEQR